MQESAAIGTSKSADATVTGLTNGTLYYFMVAAVNAAGNESPLSAEVAAEPTGSKVVPVPSPGPPKWLIALLTAVGAMAVAAALTLIAPGEDADSGHQVNAVPAPRDETPAPWRWGTGSDPPPDGRT